MKTLTVMSKTGPDGYLHLAIPTGIADGDVEVVVVINELTTKAQPVYDFRDLAGRLHWRGDALTEQKRLREAATLEAVFAES